MLPGPWCPHRSASDHMYCNCRVCFLALGASRRTASDHIYCNMFMPSIPEILNSGMLVGVDTSLFVPMGVVSYYLYSGWGLHPRAFLNSGIRDSLLEHPSFWRYARLCAYVSCKGPSPVLGGPWIQHRHHRQHPGPGHRRLHHQATIPSHLCMGGHGANSSCAVVYGISII